MKVLVIGNGAREHALAWRLKDSPRVAEVFIAPGNPGMAALGTLVPYPVTEVDQLADFAEKNGIGFIPWFPLGAGGLAKSDSALTTVAQRYNATNSQIALAWLLKRSPVMLPIPGTSKVAHLEENVAAAAIKLTDEEFAELDRAGRAR